MIAPIDDSVEFPVGPSGRLDVLRIFQSPPVEKYSMHRLASVLRLTNLLKRRDRSLARR